MYFKKFISIAILVSLILFLNGCDTIVDVPRNTVSGKIYTFNHTEMANIKVNIENKTTYTAADGRYCVNNQAQTT